MTSRNEITSLEQIRESVPSIFRSAEQGGVEGVSQKYEFMTTSEIIDGLGDMNWNVHSASQQKSKKNPDTTKHMIRFRNGSHDFIDGCVPEIVLVNSHDRTTSLKFHMGVFRMVCSNGLIVADKTFNKFSVRHINTSFDEVKEMINQIVSDFPNVINRIAKFQGVQLTPKEQELFAMNAFSLRFPEYIDTNGDLNVDDIKTNININDLLTPKRYADNGNDLWRVFNRVQESVIKGGFIHQSNVSTQARKTRPITDIRKNLSINQGLWELAEAYVN